MQDQDIQSRLDCVSTHWTMVYRAHGHNVKKAQAARFELLHRYRGAVYRYLLAVVRNPDVAEELSQQFAVKFLKGEFHKADPGRGRFRDYVKTALVNLVRRHYKDQANAPGPLPDEVKDSAWDPPTDEQVETEFVRQWRTEVMDQTWNALSEERPVYHDLLRLRVDEPNLTSREIAERYTAQFSKPMTPANVRKTLERAHAKFADLLIREIALSLEQPSREWIRTELKELDLLKYCRSAIERWTPPGTK